MSDYPVSYEKCNSCPCCSLVTKTISGMRMPEGDWYYQCLANNEDACSEPEKKEEATTMENDFVVMRKAPWDKEINRLTVQIERYSNNNNMCIQLYGIDPDFGFPEPWNTATTNVGKLPEGQVAIKAYSENVGLDLDLIAAEVIQHKPVSIRSGMPVYWLTQKFVDWAVSQGTMQHIDVPAETVAEKPATTLEESILKGLKDMGFNIE